MKQSLFKRILGVKPNPETRLVTVTPPRRGERTLLERLDAVSVIYRLASAVADAGGPPVFRWYRGGPGRRHRASRRPNHRSGQAGYHVRQDRLSKRLWRPLDPSSCLTGGPLTRALLALMPDEARRRQVRKLTARSLVRRTWPWKTRWRMPRRRPHTAPAVLRYKAGPALRPLSYARPGGGLPTSRRSRGQSCRRAWSSPNQDDQPRTTGSRPSSNLPTSAYWTGSSSGPGLRRPTWLACWEYRIPACGV